MRNKLIVVCLMFILCVAGAQAQLTTAMLSGTVKDASGAVVVGAAVTATNIGTNLVRTAKTNDRGEYRIEFLPIGSYNIEVAAQGFSKYVQKGMVLEINQSGRFDAILKPGAVEELVEVAGAAPLVNTNNAEIGQTIQNVEIQSLPLVNRNVYKLLDITPGVQSNVNEIALGFPVQKTLINGGSDGNYTGTVNYFLDGGTNMTGLRNTGNPLPNPDAIQEFRVQTNAYSAEYGRFANGVVNVVTKSGTNEFHGSAFEFWRNDKLNAKPWGSQQGSGPLHRNQFGFTLGGPIKKNKTFFFGSYAGLRQVTSSFMNSAIVPTELERAGDFSKTLSKGKPVYIADPVRLAAGLKCGNVVNGVVNTAGCFPGNVIPQNRMDPAALKILNTFIPQPNAITSTNNYQGFHVNPYNSDDYLIKIDHQLTAKHQLSGSFFTNAGDNSVNGGSSNVPWSEQQYKWRQTNVNVSDTYIINSSMVNQTWLVYSRMMGGRLNVCAGIEGACASSDMSLRDFGSTFLPQGTPSLPQITVNGYFTLGSAIAGPVAGSNMYSLRDVFSLNHGRHNMRFGGEVSLEKDDQATLLNNYGQFTFDTSLTTNGFANFLLGIPSRITQDSPVEPSTSTYNIATFFQDDFRVLPNLTLNLGLRWDIQTPPTDTMDRMSTFIPGQKSVVNPNAPVGLVFPGDEGVSRGIVPVRWGHISPRFGFAYDPWNDGKTSIRGGAGLFWGSISGNEWNQTSNFQPFSTRLTFTNTGTINGATLSDPYRNYTGGAPFPYNGQFTNGGSTLGIAPGFDWPYTYQLNLSVQRQLTSTTSTSVAYVGSMSHNLPFSYDLNYPVLDQTSQKSGTSVQNRRPNQAFGSISQTMSNQTSSYNSLQVTGNKRMSHNVNVTTSYVWSKTLCSAQLQGGSTGVAQNLGKLWEDRGPCDSDVRHAFNLAIVFQPDYYHGDSKVLGHILNGWQISPIFRVRSGSPFSVLNGLDANMDGYGNDRAQLIGDPFLSDRSKDQWFNTAAFVQNVPVEAVKDPSNPTKLINGAPVDGNSPRNFLYGPGAKYLDLALSRTFKFTERYKLEFRGEATNALNIVNLNDPSANMSNLNTFGKISGARSMREIQLGLRLLF
ncbi:MAG TPA: carboxypeptidase regulatory-like domain-containing protein [Clostridia bacterium]|nr:carboxypeptidase regulatory-like domain-containing protein [Clostridia bacterium]